MKKYLVILPMIFLSFACSKNEAGKVNTSAPGATVTPANGDGAATPKGAVTLAEKVTSEKGLEIGKTYWLQGQVYLQANSGDSTYIPYSPFQVRVYGVNKKSGIPVFEVISGSLKGFKNSCYEVEREDIESYCADESRKLIVVPVQSSAARLSAYPVRGHVSLNDTKISDKMTFTALARMSQSGVSIADDFNEGQILDRQSKHYKMEIDTPTTGVFDQVFYHLSLFKLFDRKPVAVKTGDVVEIYGQEDYPSSNADEKTYYIVKIKFDGNIKGYLSDYFVLIPKKLVIIAPAPSLQD